MRLNGFQFKHMQIDTLINITNLVKGELAAVVIEYSKNNAA